LTRPGYPVGQASSPWELLAIITAISSVGVLGFSVSSPILPDLRDALGVSEGAIGLVQSMIAVPGIVASIPLGYVADRFGRRRVTLLSLLAFGTLGSACYFARTLWLLLTLRFLQGLAMSGILGFGMVLIGDFFRGPERTRVMGINQAGMMLTATVGPVIAGLLALGDHAFRPFLFFLVTFPMTLWASRLPAVPAQAETPQLGRHAKNTLAMLRERGSLTDFVGIHVAALLVVGVGIGLGLTVVPLLLDSRFGVPVVWRGVIVASFQLGGALTAMSVGRLRRTIGFGRTLTLGMACLGFGTALVGTAVAPWMAFVGEVVAGAGFGFFIPLGQTYVSTVATPTYRGTASGMWMSVNRLAQSVAPPLGTTVIVLAGAGTALVAGGASVLVAAAAWRPLRAVLNGRRSR
jgi:ACDE family multidrug resistance protein